jgi:hypothetical protein
MSKFCPSPQFVKYYIKDRASDNWPVGEPAILCNSYCGMSWSSSSSPHFWVTSLSLFLPFFLFWVFSIPCLVPFLSLCFFLFLFLFGILLVFSMSSKFCWANQHHGWCWLMMIFQLLPVLWQKLSMLPHVGHWEATAIAATGNWWRWGMSR